MTQQRLAMIPVADLTVGANIRQDPGDIDSLVESIRLLGVLEPIVVWPSEDGTHAEVGMGQRRFNAARVAGLTEVPCLLRPRPDERERVLMQLAENHERADMSPIDEARAFADLQDLGISRRAIARSLRKTEEWVYRRQKLLEYPHPIQDAVHRGSLSPYIALEFPLALATDREAMRRLPKGQALTDKGLREWVKAEYRARAGTNRQIQRTGVRVIPVDHDAYDLAKATAKAAGIPMGEWTARAIHAYADHGAQTEAVA